MTSFCSVFLTVCDVCLYLIEPGNCHKMITVLCLFVFWLTFLFVDLAVNQSTAGAYCFCDDFSDCLNADFSTVYLKRNCFYADFSFYLFMT